MNDMTYQVYFKNGSGEREYLNENFYSKGKAEKAVDRLIDKGFKDVAYVGFSFDIGLP